eukprot:scaffold12726_cov20-Tisochrysis_lutea.AAC.2
MDCSFFTPSPGSFLLVLNMKNTELIGVVLRVMFHPKQLQLFSGGDDSEVRVWDLVEKRCTATLQVRNSRGCAKSTTRSAAHFSAATLIASPAGPLLSSDMLGAFPGWLAAAQWRPGQGGGGVGPTHQQQGGHHPSLHICSGLAHRQQGGHQPGAKSGERWGPEPLYKVSTMSADGRCLLLRMRKVTTMFADSQGLSPHAF